MRVYLLILVFITTSIATSTEPVLHKIWEQTYDFSSKYSKFSPDGQFIYSVNSNTIEKISVETGELLKRFDNSGQTFEIYDVELSKLGNYIVTAHSSAGVSIWSTIEEKLLYHISFDEDEKETGVECATISPDESILLIPVAYDYYQDSELIRYDVLVEWDIHEKKEIRRKQIDTYADKIRYSKDGNFFALASIKMIDVEQDEKAGVVSIWDAKEIESIKEIQYLEDFNNYKFMYFSEFDEYVVIGSRRSQIYRLSDSKLMFESGNKYHYLQLLPDNKHFLVNNRNVEDNLELYNFDGLIKKFTEYIELINADSKDDHFLLLTKNGNNIFENYLYELDIPSNVIEDIDKEKNLNITYKSNIINIILDELSPYNSEIKIYNLSGDLVLSQNFPPSDQLNIPIELSPGIYICSIKINDHYYSRKFVVGGK